MILPDVDLKPVLIPHHKGRKRLHLGMTLTKVLLLNTVNRRFKSVKTFPHHIPAVQTRFFFILSVFCLTALGGLQFLHRVVSN